MRLSQDLVCSVYREVADPGVDLTQTAFKESDYDEHLFNFLKNRTSGRLHVFAYGSLIWKPAFRSTFARHATAHGWHRAFSLWIERFRGTKEVPGLMMQIDLGGSCHGILQQVPEESEWNDLSLLWRREMTVKPPGNTPTWIEVESAGQTMKAIAFTANRENSSYAGGLSKFEVAQVLSAACGHWGSCADYLRQTVLSLEANNIHDPLLWELQELVAVQIERRKFHRPPV